MLQGDVSAVIVSATVLIGAMQSMGLSEAHMDKVSEALIAREVVAVHVTDVASILRAAGVPATKILLLQARLTDASMNSPPADVATARPGAVPLAMPAAEPAAVAASSQPIMTLEVCVCACVRACVSCLQGIAPLPV